MSRKGCCRGGICRICPLVSDLSFLCPSYDTILVQFLLLVDSNTKIVPSFVSLYLSDSFPVQFCKLDLDQLKAHSVIHRLCQKCSKLSLWCSFTSLMLVHMFFQPHVSLFVSVFYASANLAYLPFPRHAFQSCDTVWGCPFHWKLKWVYLMSR